LVLLNGQMQIILFLELGDGGVGGVGEKFHSSELLALTDNFLVQTLINPANLDSLRLCASA
ncbi:hypothetical protein QHH11_27645, partial [Aphanizomenon sp. PH219]|nr:hypothetical protein [Aphanizomenon sp. PH219]